MSKPNIEVLDDGDAHPYSSHISIEGTELHIGDLLLVFESETSYTINFFERVYGFTWPGIITHVIDGPVPAEFRDFEKIAGKLESGKIAIAAERERMSFFIDDKTVRTLSLYRHFHQDGWQPILVDERGDALEESPSTQSVILCEDSSQVIKEVIENRPPSDQQEFEHVVDFLRSSGHRSESIPAFEDVDSI